MAEWTISMILRPASGALLDAFRTVDVRFVTPLLAIWLAMVTLASAALAA
jgi:hypothetical protein